MKSRSTIKITFIHTSILQQKYDEEKFLHTFNYLPVVRNLNFLKKSVWTNTTSDTHQVDRFLCLTLNDGTYIYCYNLH